MLKFANCYIYPIKCMGGSESSEYICVIEVISLAQMVVMIICSGSFHGYYKENTHVEGIGKTMRNESKHVTTKELTKYK